MTTQIPQIVTLITKNEIAAYIDGLDKNAQGGDLGVVNEGAPTSATAKIVSINTTDADWKTFARKFEASYRSSIQSNSARQDVDIVTLYNLAKASLGGNPDQFTYRVAVKEADLLTVVGVFKDIIKPDLSSYTTKEALGGFLDGRGQRYRTSGDDTTQWFYLDLNWSQVTDDQLSQLTTAFQSELNGADPEKALGETLFTLARVSIEAKEAVQAEANQAAAEEITNAPAQFMKGSWDTLTSDQFELLVSYLGRAEFENAIGTAGMAYIRQALLRDGRLTQQEIIDYKNYLNTATASARGFTGGGRMSPVMVIPMIMAACGSSITQSQPKTDLTTATAKADAVRQLTNLLEVMGQIETSLTLSVGDSENGQKVEVQGLILNTQEASGYVAVYFPTASSQEHYVVKNLYGTDLKADQVRGTVTSIDAFRADLQSKIIDEYGLFWRAQKVTPVFSYNATDGSSVDKLWVEWSASRELLSESATAKLLTIFGGADKKTKRDILASLDLRDASGGRVFTDEEDKAVREWLNVSFEKYTVKCGDDQGVTIYVYGQADRMMWSADLECGDNFLNALKAYERYPISSAAPVSEPAVAPAAPASAVDASGL